MTLTACGNSNPMGQQEQLADTVVVQPNSKDIRMTHDNLVIEKITKVGLGDFKIGAKIPESHPDYEITQFINVDEEEMEEVGYEVGKNGEVLFILYPSYLPESDCPSDEIGQIMVISDQFVHNGVRVGDNINEVLKHHPELKTTYWDDGYFRIADDNVVYFVYSDGYDGPIPEVPFDIPVPVEKPTFMDDAAISSIWIYQ